MQVFSNLLNNAAKFTKRGGRISLIAQQRGSKVVVTVKDNGIGIAAQLLPSVFDMFMQADRSRAQAGGGLGLGLHIVQRLVNAHGGSVEAASEGVDMGSEFVVSLPRALSLIRPVFNKCSLRFRYGSFAASCSLVTRPLAIKDCSSLF